MYSNGCLHVHLQVLLFTCHVVYILFTSVVVQMNVCLHVMLVILFINVYKSCCNALFINVYKSCCNALFINVYKSCCLLFTSVVVQMNVSLHVVLFILFINVYKSCCLHVMPYSLMFTSHVVYM